MGSWGPPSFSLPLLPISLPGGKAVGLETHKRLLEGLAWVYAQGLRPEPVAFLDPRIRELDRILAEMRELEPDPVMRLRWDIFRRILLWLVSRDGAYRIRALVLLQKLAEAGEVWKLHPWECRYWEG